MPKVSELGSAGMFTGTTLNGYRAGKPEELICLK